MSPGYQTTFGSTGQTTERGRDHCERPGPVGLEKFDTNTSRGPQHFAGPPRNETDITQNKKFRQCVFATCPPPLFGGSWKKVLTGPCPFVSLVSMNEDQARKARKQLLRELPDPTEILRGSLLDRRIFHRRGCRKCRRGEGHRVWVLTVGYPG